MSLIASDGAQLLIGSPPTALAGLRRRSLTLSRKPGDRSHAGSGPWAETTALGGPMAAELRAEGVFVSGEAAAALRTAFLEGEAEPFALDLPGEGVWSGPFVVRSLSLSGRAEGEVAFSLRLVSAGPVTFASNT